MKVMGPTTSFETNFRMIKGLPTDFVDQYFYFMGMNDLLVIVVRGRPHGFGAFLSEG